MNFSMRNTYYAHIHTVTRLEGEKNELKCTANVPEIQYQSLVLLVRPYFGGLKYGQVKEFESKRFFRT